MPEQQPEQPPEVPAPGRMTDPGRDRLQSALMRPGKRQVVVAVLLAVLGFAFVVQVRDTQADDTYSGLRESELIQVFEGLTGTAAPGGSHPRSRKTPRCHRAGYAARRHPGW